MGETASTFNAGYRRHTKQRGFNSQGTGGARPNYLTTSYQKLIRIKNGFAQFSSDIKVASESDAEERSGTPARQRC